MSEVIPVPIPLENVNDEAVTLNAWLVADGEYVAEGQGLAMLETSKANVEIPAPASGYVRHNFQIGSEMEIGAILCYITQSLSDISAESLKSDKFINPQPSALAGDASSHLSNLSPTPPPTRIAEPLEVSEKADHQATRFSHKAQRLIEERGMDSNRFAGRGLVREIDVQEALGIVGSATLVKPSNNSACSRASVTATPGVPFSTEELPRAKRLEIKMLAVGAANTLTSCVTVSCRTRGLRALARQSTELQVNAPAIIVYESARILRSFRELNGFYADGCANYYEEVNVGYALNAGEGLKVPVIRRADEKSLLEIASQLDESLVGYVGGTLTPEDLSGGTFIVTDLFSEDVATLTPLISQGQSAILAVGGEVFASGTNEGSDHQMADGRRAAKFLNELRRRLSGYEETLLLESADREESREVFCAQCLRPVNELRPANAHLLQTAIADGTTKLVCTICLSGW